MKERKAPQKGQGSGKRRKSWWAFALRVVARLRISRAIHRRTRWTFPIRVAARYLRIGGSHYAAAFAFYAFFSLFPLLLLLVNLGSLFVDKQKVSDRIIGSLQVYLPIGDEHRAALIDMMEQMVNSRGTVSLVAGGFLVFAASRLFKALVHGIDRAWNCEPPSWWVVPAKNLILLLVMGSALLLGFLLPIGLKSVQSWIVPYADLARPLFRWLLLLAPTLILFYGLLWFYRLVPGRLGKLRFVWMPALGTAIALTLFQSFFIWIIDYSVGTFPVLYEVAGLVMALLYGTFISGAIMLFGGCACAELAGRDGTNRTKPSSTTPQRSKR